LFQVTDDATNVGVEEDGNPQFSYPGISISHSVKPNEKRCSCGKWQDFGYPCTHAMAYFWNWEEKAYSLMVAENVHYCLRHAYQGNHYPVVIDVIEQDTNTFPPKVEDTRPAHKEKD